MSSFPLKIVTADGLLFDGPADKLIVRTTTGDVCILARHIPFAAPLGMGRAVVVSGNVRRTAACIGGLLSVVDGTVTLVPTTFEWAGEIDPARAEASRRRAEQVLQDLHSTDTDRKLAEARLRRALVRIEIASAK